MLALIPLRWKVLPKIFTDKEFGILDAPTANNNVVLASLGGKPRLPKDKDEAQNESEDPASSQEDKWSTAERDVERGATRQRVGTCIEE